MKLPDKSQIKKVRSHPDVTKIEVTTRKTTVTTKCIYIKHRKKKYKIGRFKIIHGNNPYIAHYGQAYSFTFINLDAKIEEDYGEYGEYIYHTAINPVPKNGRGHLGVNVFKNGTMACLGNITNILEDPKLPFSTAICLLIEFLKSHEDYQAHVPIKLFKVVK